MKTIKTMNRSSVVLLISLLCGGMLSASATTRYVSPTGNDSDTGLSWLLAKKTIQAAVTLSVDGDTVRVGDGTYLLTSVIDVTTAITIESVSGADVTTIDAQGNCRGFMLNTLACTLSGFTITNGATTGNGGGIYCTSINPIVNYCTFTGNNADAYGGGCRGGTLNNCTFTDNRASMGGGGSYSSTLYDCTLSNNSTDNNGGGSYEDTLYNCTFTDNWARYNGGGSYQSTLNNCTLTGNEADEGSGGGSYEGTLDNCALIDNLSDYSGGGSYEGILDNCTLSGNSSWQGGGSYGGTLRNCIVWGNSASGSGTDVSSATCGNTCASDGVADGVSSCIISDPLFMDADSGDYRLQSTSPCLNAGKNAYVFIEMDLDGNPRTVGDAVDMGAYEFGSSAMAVTHYVNVYNGSPSWPYTRWETASTDIQSAVDVASAGDTVLVTNGTYMIISEISVTQAVNIESVNGWDVTAVNGQESCRCVYLGAADCTLSGFTIVNGYTAFNGGGIYCNSTNPVITNCTLANSKAGDEGGGIYYGTLINCTLSGNSAHSGGGSFDSTLTDCMLSGNTASSDGGGSFYGLLTGCTFYNNYADAGGGGSCRSRLTDCTLVDNTTGFQGGGSYLGTLDNCTLSGNEATFGGGSYRCLLYNCRLLNNSATGYDGGGSYGGSLYNCTLSGNDAVEHGGGSYEGTLYSCTLSENTAQYGGGSYDSTLNNCTLSENEAADGGGSYLGTLNNCTIYDNNATWHGGGSYEGTLNNCIIYGNTKLLGVDNEYNSTLDYCSTADPFFVYADGGNYHLKTNSPCINAGKNSLVESTTDKDGRSRIINGTVDIGAYEVMAEHTGNSPVHYVSPDGANVWPYTSWLDAATSIQDAVGAAVAQDTVWVTNGVYDAGTTVTPNLNCYNRLVITKNVTVQSVNGPENTLIVGEEATSGGNGYGAVRGVYLGAGELIGFTITNGHTITSGSFEYDQSGGGINAFGGTGVISNCLLSGNSAIAGGGSYSGTLTDCTLSDNEAADGGGSYLGTLTDCTLSDNTATNNGGGSYEGMLTDCILSGNTASISGGGSCLGVLTDCILSGNEASGNGGGSYGGTLSRCELTDNKALSSSGGGSCDGTLNNCTLVDNFGYNGGGSYLGTLNNCTLANNSAVNFGGSRSNTLNNCIIYGNAAWNGGSISGSTQNRCWTTDPLFVDASAGNYRLLPDSLCIDEGDNALIVGTTDLDGNVRSSGIVDIGAYEYNSLFSDSDGDASTDHEEAVADTDPLDSSDYFHINGINGNTVFFDSSSGRLYTLCWSTNLVEGIWTSIAPARYGVGGSDSITGIHNIPAEYFKVEVEMP